MMVATVEILMTGPVISKYHTMLVLQTSRYYSYPMHVRICTYYVQIPKMQCMQIGWYLL